MRSRDSYLTCVLIPSDARMNKQSMTERQSAISTAPGQGENWHSCHLVVMVTGSDNASLRRGGNVSGQDERGRERRRREGERESVGWEPSKEDREFNHREVPTDGHVECERAGGSSSCVWYE